jgi:DNA-binding CsgD family transcriptional regulator
MSVLDVDSGPVDGPVEADAAQRAATDVRVIVIAEDALLRRGLRLLLADAGMRAYDVESIARARRLCSFGGTSNEVLVWAVDELDRDVASAANALAGADGGPGVCLLVGDVQVDVLRRLLTDCPYRLGVLLRRADTEPGALAGCVSEVAAGELSISPALMSRIFREERSRGPELTPIEESVLELMTAGWRNCEIARRLRRSEKSIENNVGKIFAKLGLDGQVNSRIDRRVTAALLYSSRRHVDLALHAPEP